MWSPLTFEAFAVGDVVLDRSCGGDLKNDASLVLNSISPSAALDASEVRPLLRRLERLEGSSTGEFRRLQNVRQLLNRHIMGGPSEGREVREGALPLGIVAALAKAGEGSFGKDLSAATQLLCGILAFLPFDSRAAVRIASNEIHGQFKGVQQIVSIRVARISYGARDERQRNSASTPVHFVEVRPLRCAPPSSIVAPTFIVSKRSVKVYSLKPGDEVFFRPAMAYLGGYDQSQDWPRGRIMDWRRNRHDCCSGLGRLLTGLPLCNSSHIHPAIRPDGFMIIKTWSWRLSSNDGATIVARWSDVRRARPRAKHQVSGI
jgi:hypothetical protein